MIDRLGKRSARRGGACVVAVVGLLALAAACSPPVPTTTRRVDPSRDSSESGTSSGAATTGDDVDDEDVIDEATPDPDPDSPAAPDGDGDGVADADDCDPASPAVGVRLLDDALTTDKGFFAAADGFSAASWSYDAAGYRQTRLADAVDLSLLDASGAVGDVLVDVSAASTEVGDLTPRLRQMFIVVGATVSGGQLSAVGCGVEVVGGETPEQKTSVVRFAGSPAAVTTTPIQRVARAALQVDEPFTMKARLAGGTLTCDVTHGGVTTTATATGLGALKGAVGLLTRQTKGLFKQGRVCALK